MHTQPTFVEKITLCTYCATYQRYIYIHRSPLLKLPNYSTNDQYKNKSDFIQNGVVVPLVLNLYHFSGFHRFLSCVAASSFRYVHLYIFFINFIMQISCYSVTLLLYVFIYFLFLFQWKLICKKINEKLEFVFPSPCQGCISQSVTPWQ